MENLKELLIKGFSEEINKCSDYSQIRNVRNTLSTENFKLCCFDSTKDIYTISFKSLISRVEYKDVSGILNEIDNKFEKFKSEIITDMQKNDYQKLVDIANE